MYPKKTNLDNSLSAFLENVAKVNQLSWQKFLKFSVDSLPKIQNHLLNSKHQSLQKQ